MHPPGHRAGLDHQPARADRREQVVHRGGVGGDRLEPVGAGGHVQHAGDRFELAQVDRQDRPGRRQHVVYVAHRKAPFQQRRVRFNVPRRSG
jgi:hypothetical protein